MINTSTYRLINGNNKIMKIDYSNCSNRYRILNLKIMWSKFYLCIMLPDQFNQ